MTALVGAAVLLGAVAQSVSGIGFVLVCGPLLVAALGPAEGVRLAVVLSLALNAVLLVRGRRDVRAGRALQLLVPAALATPVAVRLLRQAPERVAEALAGAAAVLGAAALAAGLRWRAAAGAGGAVLAGVLSGAMNAAAGIGGPAAALYAENAGWDPATARATLQLHFLGLNLVALAALGLPRTGGLLPVAAGCLAAGLLLGAPLASRVATATARRVTLALAGAGGAVVLAGALRG